MSFIPLCLAGFSVALSIKSAASVFTGIPGVLGSEVDLVLCGIWATSTIYWIVEYVNYTRRGK